MSNFNITQALVDSYYIFKGRLLIDDMSTPTFNVMLYH